MAVFNNVEDTNKTAANRTECVTQSKHLPRDVMLTSYSMIWSGLGGVESSDRCVEGNEEWSRSRLSRPCQGVRLIAWPVTCVTQCLN